MILDRNFKRLQSLYMVKLDLKMMFGDVLKRNQSDSDHIRRCQICAAAILDFFPIGLVYEFGSKFQISLNFVYGQIEPGNHVC